MRICPIIFLLAVVMLSSQWSYAEISSEDKAFVTSFITRIKDAGDDPQKQAEIEKEFFSQQGQISKYVSDDEAYQQEDTSVLSLRQRLLLILSACGIAVLIISGIDVMLRERGRAEDNRLLEQRRADIEREQLAARRLSMNNMYHNSYYGYGNWE